MPPLSPERFANLATSMGLSFNEREQEEIDTLRAITESFVGSLESILSTPEPPRPPVVSRSFQRPNLAENNLGAWVLRTSIREADAGRLAGRTVALKDNIALAGVPMSGGTDFLEGYVPEEDATIVKRMLAEGAEITGKAACEYLSASAGSHTSASGPIHNPHDPTRTAGGSSAGSGALVAAGEVDLAIGGDQGGSIRYPASFCGIVGMKPTHGLVPYTGILSLDAHVDHTGPMTANVRDNAVLLEVLAGPDGIDPRQYAARTSEYAQDLDAGVEGLRIGVLEEGFHESIEPGVDRAVRNAIRKLEGRGATIDFISVPDHESHSALIAAFLMVGNWALVSNGGFPLHACQPIPFGLAEAFARWKTHSEKMTPNVKLMLLAGAHVSGERGGEIYAKALRLREAARAQYDGALAKVDALLMPTTLSTAPALPPENPSAVESFVAISPGVSNVAQFDATGHPAISVPCGEAEGLPVGCMLVGRHFEEAMLYRVAASVERDRDL